MNGERSGRARRSGRGGTVVKSPARAPQAERHTELFERRIRDYAAAHPGTVHILEAGCGRSWPLDLTGTDFHLTGVDLNAKGMRARVEEFGDLDEVIIGDLRTVELKQEAYDIAYCFFVLEHIAGAEQVLDRIFAALKPGGLLLLRMPDGDSVYGFAARHSPYWLHVQYKRFIRGNRLAGQPGHGPFPTVYDRVVSMRGMRKYCADHGLEIVDAFVSNQYLERLGVAGKLIGVGLTAAARLSGGRLSAETNATLVIRKPA